MGQLSNNRLDKTLAQAADMCQKNGIKLTPKRSKLLSGLLVTDRAQSAYDLIEIMKREYGETLQPTTVYRMLDILSSENLVHKLHLSNRYIACSHICCDHGHDVPQFFVCDGCHKVVEISVDPTMIADFSRQAAANQFVLTSPQIELHCLCQDCQSSASQPSKHMT